MEKEDFINSILNSTNGISQVVPNDDLFIKIQRKIQSEKTPNGTIWFVAASIIILFSLNISLLFAGKNSIENTNSSIENAVNNNNQLY